jgi:hypothetical protein
MSYDFLKTFSYNGPYGTKLILKINCRQTLTFILFKLSIQISLMTDNSGKSRLVLEL